VPDEEWPEASTGQRDIILSDFAPGVGDRRQEIVFIGAGMDEVRVCVWGGGGQVEETEALSQSSLVGHSSYQLYKESIFPGCM